MRIKIHGLICIKSEWKWWILKLKWEIDNQFLEREQKWKTETREENMNSDKGHESSLLDFLTGKPVSWQNWRKPKPAFQNWNPINRIWTREHQEAIRLAGFLNRLAGFESLQKFSFPDVLNRKSGFVPVKFQTEFGFPDLRTGRPVMRQRGGLANPVFRIENPIIRILSRD